MSSGVQRMLLAVATCVIAGLSLPVGADETPEVAPSDEVITPAEAAALEEAQETAPDEVEADAIPGEDPVPSSTDDEVKT